MLVSYKTTTRADQFENLTSTSIVLELNAVPRFAIDVPRAHHESPVIRELVHESAQGTWQDGDLEVPIRIEALSTASILAVDEMQRLTLQGRMIAPSLEIWFDEVSPHADCWHLSQRREKESLAIFFSRLFGEKLDALADSAPPERMIPARSTVIRPGDIDNRQFLERFTGWLRERLTRILGWIVCANADQSPVQLVIAPLDHNTIPEFTLNDDLWSLNASPIHQLAGNFWLAQQVRRYVRTDWDGNWDLKLVLHDQRHEATPTPGVYRIDGRLFICLRTEIIRRDTGEDPAREVIAYFAPYSLVSFNYPQLPATEFHLPATMQGWTEDGDCVRVKIDDAWCVLNGIGTQLDTVNPLLTEYYTTAPPLGTFAGVYLKPQAETTVVVQVANGAVPRIDGGPQRRCQSLETTDISINCSSLVLSTSQNDQDLANANRLELAAETAVLSALQQATIQSRKVTVRGSQTEVTIAENTVVSEDLYVVGRVEMG
jgi:hypothetical protein